MASDLVRDQALIAHVASVIDAKAKAGVPYAEGGPGFDSRALVEHLDGEVFVLQRPLSYRAKGGWSVTVPSGLVYDGASIPKAVWSLLPSKAECLEFGTLHDWMYRVGPSIGVRKRGTADDLGWEALVLQNIGDEWQRDAIWEGLHIGGGPAWRKWRDLGLAWDSPGVLTAQ